MALRDRVKNQFERFATATLATLATHPPTEPENVATVAEVAVATSDDRNTRVNVPTPCRDCKRLEVIEIMNELVPGCLYQAEGEFPEGWRRIAAGVARCIWTPAAMGRQTSADINQDFPTTPEETTPCRN